MKIIDDETVIQFDELLHKYTYNGITLTSVTQFLETYVPNFSPIFPSIAVAKKNTKEGSGLQTASDVRKFWNISGTYAKTLGTLTHMFAQLYLMDNSIQPQTGYEVAVIKALKEIEKDFNIIEQEKLVYNVNVGLAGQIDLILEHKITGEIWIGDWKTTKNMDKSYGKMTSPFFIKADSFVKYAIQLGTYAFLNNTKLENVLIIQLKSDGSFEIITDSSLPNVKDALLKEITKREEIVIF